MWRSICVFGLLLAVCVSAPAQRRGRSSGGKSQVKIPEFETPIATFRGTLRSVDKKEIVIALPEDQEVTFHCSRKTRFLKDSKKIKPSDIQAGTEVSVEARRDLFGDVEAVTVTVPPPEK